MSIAFELGQLTGLIIIIVGGGIAIAYLINKYVLKKV
jgi:hypothetical protein